MALSAAQIAALENNPGIDQKLVANYKKNNPAATVDSTVNSPEDAADRINKFNAALNVGVDQARQQRKDATLDFVGGMVPPGALPATSFAGVLSAFDSDSAPLEASLLNNASAFAEQQAQAAIDTTNSIRELALKVGEQGGSQDTVNAIAALAATGDIDTAIKLGATALGTDYQSAGGNIIKLNKTDGSYEVIYSAPKSSPGPKSDKMTMADAKSIAQTLIRSRWGQDPGESYANSEDYLTAYQGWLDDGFLAKDFFAAFPPNDNVNPNDPTVAEDIKREIKQPKAEKTESTGKVPPKYGEPGYDEYVATGEY